MNISILLKAANSNDELRSHNSGNLSANKHTVRPEDSTGVKKQRLGNQVYGAVCGYVDDCGLTEELQFKFTTKELESFSIGANQNIKARRRWKGHLTGSDGRVNIIQSILASVIN
ncbi:unnamed protein product [Acanthoscelides obtectus]|uniref:Uncharacterized protein n=1 Tax=Acanthoscelides obtectus TaxID=200917 RepID=A0A9P0PZ94_ACAOB|nr:unnamed protein product [Acanthoscelides obtectus]CAK1647740.1 hypothetical protein AOBTE_LOCUS15374 [Acanthoscelides obtectus]